VRLGRTEQSSQLLIPYADEFKEQKQIDCGNIAAVTGLKVSTILFYSFLIHFSFDELLLGE